MQDVLVTLPVHNEAGLLLRTVHELKRALDATEIRYRLAIAEDGSTDGTCAILARIRAELPDVIIQSQPARAGRGGALRELWAKEAADIYVFVDADLAAGPPAVIDVIRAAEAGADVVTGSRYCPGARVHRPFLRNAVSLAYNALIRGAFRETVRDHQCGLKAFSRRAIATLLPISHENSWAWDTEMMVLAGAAGYPVREIPVDWTEYRTQRTRFKRLASDLWLHGTALLRLKGDFEQRLARVAAPTVDRGAFDDATGAHRNSPGAFLR